LIASRRESRDGRFPADSGNQPAAPGRQNRRGSIAIEIIETLFNKNDRAATVRFRTRSIARRISTK
jgi:hypothetical protein